MYIYKIINKINGKIYIGQTSGSIKSRWQKHCCFSNSKPGIGAAIKKHGKENFIIKEIGGANSQSELDYKEWLLIHNNNSLAPNGYNLREGGNSRGKVTKITKQKISKAHTGRKHSKKSKLNMSIGSLGQVGGMKNKNHKKESNIKNAISNGGKLFNMKKDSKIIWSGYIISECAREFSLSIGNISGCLNGNRKTHKGYTFEYGV